MGLFDTHTHIHDSEFEFSDTVYQDSISSNVSGMVCVGTDLRSSKQAIDFVADKHCAWASIGLHPHEARDYVNDEKALDSWCSLVNAKKVVAIGECGLDYYYNNSPKEDQKMILRMQLELALKHLLPVILHIRDAFDDFWPIFDEYKGLRGVVHSFTASQHDLDESLSRGLYIGLNGIMTFTKDKNQLEVAKQVPIGSLMLETDAPFLTPVPKRGTMNEPKYLMHTAEFLSRLRNQSLEELMEYTTENAVMLFGV